MKKEFWGFVIFLLSVSIVAQQDAAAPAKDALAQTPSKEIINADSSAGKRLEQTDSTGQNGVNSAAALKISTDPAQASLKIGERDYGLTPVTITGLDVGEHILELSKSGHFRRKVTIQLDSAGADLHFALLAPASIFITSEPEGAQVIFDGKPSGITPFKSERMRPGDYPLSLSIDGYELYETAVSLKSGLNDTLHVTLESLEPEVIAPESQAKEAPHSSQPKKSLFSKEYKRSGIAATAFFVFIAVLIGIEKTSY